MLNQTRAMKSKSGRGQDLVAYRLLAVLLLLLVLWGQSAFAARLDTKPGRGAQLDTSHPLARGLVRAWLFNEGGGNVFDIAGRTTGTITNAPTWQSGRLGWELDFLAASDQYVNAGNPAVLQ